MPLDFSNISTLSPALTTNGDDVVISGHGSYEFSGETVVPTGVELWVLAPPGASISDDLGGALESMQTISKLAIYSPATRSLNNTAPTRYAAGKAAPDYHLHAPRGLVLKPGGPHVIGVEQQTSLSALWVRVQPFIRAGRTTRVFWAACTAIDGAANQVVIHR